jgi:predicted acylesterase/phospholipase RssA
MSEPVPARLRADLPFRRIAVVLAGGGAWGAYEIGVFKTLEAVGLRPKILAGVSVGAINAVVWLSHGFQSRLLERAWGKLRPSSIGMSWVTLGMRAIGVFLVVLAAVEILLTLAGSPELQILTGFRQLREAWGFGLYTLFFEIVAWGLLGVVGYAMAFLTRRLEDLLGRIAPGPESDLWRRWLEVILVLLAVLYPVAMLMRVPWPWRFHGLLLVALTAIWLADRPGGSRNLIHSLFTGLMPETQGRGLWRSTRRRRLIERLLSRGDQALVFSGDVHLIISACSIHDGRMSYFINWEEPSDAFCERIKDSLGEVVQMTKPRDLVDAATAASAVPVLFEPVRYRGRDYLDAGLFSNQPIHAVLADGADAILLVLVSPSSGPRPSRRGASILELGSRLQELANWRDLQTELRHLPEHWTRKSKPERLCVVEPQEALPGWMFSFDPGSAAKLVEQGEADAWKALESAGWLLPGSVLPSREDQARETLRSRWKKGVTRFARDASKTLLERPRLRRRKT